MKIKEKAEGWRQDGKLKTEGKRMKAEQRRLKTEKGEKTED